MTVSRGSSRPLVVVASSSNGSDPGAPDAGAVRRSLGRSADVVTTDDLGAVESDPARSVSALIAHGPDSVVRRTLAAAVGTAVAFGVLRSSGDGPLGTVLAGSMPGDPGDPGGVRADAALARVIGAPLRRVDVGVVEDRPFLTTLAIGAPELAPNGSEPTGGFLGWWRRTVALPRRTGRVTVHVDGVQRWRGRTPVVLVANGPHLVRPADVHDLAGSIDPTDGELDVAVLAPRRPDRWLAMWVRLLVGGVQDRADLRWFRGSWVHVRSEVPRPYEVDGERLRPTTVVDVRVWPSSLLLCDTVPAPEPHDTEIAPDAPAPDAPAADRSDDGVTRDRDQRSETP